VNNATFSAGFQLDGFGVIIPIPDDAIIEPSEGYVYILEVIGPLDPRDVGRIDSTTNVTLVTLLDNDRRLLWCSISIIYEGSFKADGGWTTMYFVTTSLCDTSTSTFSITYNPSINEIGMCNPRLNPNSSIILQLLIL